MEYASMSERILRSIENTIKSDSDLEDFTIVPTDDNTRNKSPVLYEDHHLALESWCVKYVYEYACSKLMKVRKSLAEKKISYSIKDDLNYLIVGALFINPDVATFWNMRRELVEQEILNCEQELLFGKLVLTRKTKSNEAFAYRRWLINRITTKLLKNGVTPPLRLLEGELAVCNLTADNTPNNYHSWTHRQWCMSKLGHYFLDVALQELAFSEKWITQHVSENSGYHYRQFLIDKSRTWENAPFLTQYFEMILTRLNIVNDGEFVQVLTFLLGKPSKNKPLEDVSKCMNHVVLLLYELIVVIESIDKVYVEHESLWLHRRYVIQRLLETSYDYLGDTFKTASNLENNQIFKSVLSKSQSNIINTICSNNYGEKQPKISKIQPIKFKSTNMHRILSKSEENFVSKNLLGSALQCDLAKRHEKWVNYILGFEITS